MQTTVLIPTFNRCALLAETLTSVLAQTVPVSNIIVVNDGSTDGTDTFLSTLGAPIKVIRQENAGKSNALNTGLSHIADGWVWIIDDDDLVVPNAHETLLKLTKHSSRPAFVYGRHDRFRESSEAPQRSYLGTGYWSACADDEFYWETLKDMFAHQGSMLVDRAAFERVGRFREDLLRSQDYEMALRLARQFTPCSTQDVVMLQRVHDGERGASEARFEESEAWNKWVASDQVFFREMHESLPVETFLTGLNEPLDEWMAYMRRGTIFARRDLWAMALSDFDTAARLAAQATAPGATAEQVLQSARSALSGKYGVGQLLEDAAIARSVAEVATLSDIGGQLVKQLAIGLRWRVREAAQALEFKRAAHIASIALSWALAARSAKHNHYERPLQ